MKRIPVKKELLDAFRQKIQTDPFIKSPTVQELRSQEKRHYMVFLHFVEEHLDGYDKRLARQLNELDTPFSYRKFKDAVKKPMTATPLFIDALGYYAYREEWAAKRMTFFQLNESHNISNNPTAPKGVGRNTVPVDKDNLNEEVNSGNKEEATKNKKQALFAFLAILFALPLLFFIFKNMESPPPLMGSAISKNPHYPINHCDCVIPPLFLNSEKSDNAYSHEQLELTSWGHIKDVDELARHKKEGGKPPEWFTKNTQTIITKMKSDFPERADEVLEQNFWWTYYCAIDKLLCESGDSIRREKNIHEYGGIIADINKRLRRNAPALAENLPHRPKTFSIEGIPVNSELRDALSNTTGWKHSLGKNSDFLVTISPPHDLERLGEGFFGMPPGPIRINVNGKKCCCGPDIGIKGKGSPGDRQATVEAEINRQINTLIQEKSFEIFQKIKECAKG